MAAHRGGGRLDDATAPGRQVGFNIWTIASTLSIVGVLALTGNAARLLWRLVAETVRSTPTDEELARPLRM